MKKASEGKIDSIHLHSPTMIWGAGITEKTLDLVNKNKNIEAEIVEQGVMLRVKIKKNDVTTIRRQLLPMPSIANIVFGD